MYKVPTAPMTEIYELKSKICTLRTGFSTRLVLILSLKAYTLA